MRKTKFSVGDVVNFKPNSWYVKGYYKLSVGPYMVSGIDRNSGYALYKLESLTLGRIPNGRFLFSGSSLCKSEVFLSEELLWE